MNVPAELYTRSSRPYRVCEVAYPLHDWTATVTRCGRICWKTLTRTLPCFSVSQLDYDFDLILHTRCCRYVV